MRRAAVGIVLIASIARAAPAPASATWADWVGDWSGKLKWANCTASGAATAKLAIDAVDGMMAIDLAPAGAALEAFNLIEDDHGFAAQHADVTVQLARPRADSVDVAVRFESGCTMKATLARASSGIAACDRLASLARIESKCAKLSGKPLEDPKALARERETWAKCRGDARSKLGEPCTARAAKLELELVDAGCAPNPDSQIGVRARDCLALATAASKLSRCANFPPDFKWALSQMSALAAAAQTADAATLPLVERQCRDSHQKATALATQFSCPL